MTKLFITFEEFLQYFNLNNNNLSFNEFKKKLKYIDLKYRQNNNNYILLINWLKQNNKLSNKTIDKILLFFYDICIKKRKEFLYNWYFYHIKITEQEFLNKKFYEVKNKINNNIINGIYGQYLLKRAIRNINFEDIYINTYKSTSNLTIFKILKNLIDNITIITSSLVTPSTLKIILNDNLLFKLKCKNIFAILRGTCSNISIFNPYTLSIILKYILNGNFENLFIFRKV